MDPITIASAVAAVLGPLLPYLFKAGEKAAEEAGKRIGGDTWEWAKDLWGRLRPKVEAKPAAREAVQDAARTPDDEDVQGVLRVQLRKLLADDPVLAEELNQWCEKAKAAGVIAVASGERSAAVGGNVSGSNIITGDRSIGITQSKIDGDVVAGDKVTHVHEAVVAVVTALHQLRAPVADFVGREQELATLTRTLHAGNHVCITGMGGTGKTELALLVAERISNEYSDAQLFINLQGNDQQPRRPEEALSSFIRAFLGPGTSLPDDLEQLTQVYNSQLSGKRVLVVLDNAGDSAQVRPLRPPSGCALVVTSREAVTLPGLIPLNLDPLTNREATQLLLEISRSAGPVAEELCHLCGYLPLAIRAAGSLLAVTPDLDPADYVTQLKEEHDRLQRFGTEGVEVSVEASFSLSYARLEPEASRVFRQLAVFPATFDAKAEETICADANHTHLSNLVRRSLVVYEASTKRYRMHDLVRLFAGARLSAQERAEGRRMHALHYGNLLATAHQHYLNGGEGVGKALTLFDLERRNIETGQAWAEAESDSNDQAAEMSIDYANAGTYIFDLRQHPRLRIRSFQVALRAARRLKRNYVESLLLGNMGLAFTHLGENKQAVKLFEEALKVARESGDRRGEGNALGNLGSAHMNLGDIKRGIEFVEQQLLIDRELGYSEGNALGNLGIAYAKLGQTQQAIEYFEQALKVASDSGDRRAESHLLGNLGMIYMNSGDIKRGIELLEQQLLSDREIGDLRGESRALGSLANAYADLGETSRAIELYEERLAIAREIGDRHGEGVSLGGLGTVYADLGEHRLAIGLYEQRLALAREIGDRLGEGEMLGNLGVAHSNLNDARRAVELFDDGLLIDRETGDRVGEGYKLYGKGRALHQLGEREQAIAVCEEAFAILQQIGDRGVMNVAAQLALWEMEASDKASDSDTEEKTEKHEG